MDPLTGLTRYEGVRWVDAEFNDGDSFLVELPDGRRVGLRLYEADCIELHVPDESQARRLRAQRRYFGISDAGGSPESSIELAKEYAAEAAAFTRSALAAPFTIHTSHADARGGETVDRIYAFVTTPDGRDLAAALVRRGLARAFGVYRRTPGNIHRDEAEERMDDLELLAAGSRQGVWKHTDWEKLPGERIVERLGDPELIASLDRRPIAGPASVAVNRATADELERVPGIGPVTASRIIEAREADPFRNPGDLQRVPGIGPKTAGEIAGYLDFSP
jgi:endonuclease YncB( thermonuclease family)